MDEPHLPVKVQQALVLLSIWILRTRGTSNSIAFDNLFPDFDFAKSRALYFPNGASARKIEASTAHLEQLVRSGYPDWATKAKHFLIEHKLHS